MIESAQTLVGGGGGPMSQYIDTDAVARPTVQEPKVHDAITIAVGEALRNIRTGASNTARMSRGLSDRGKVTERLIRERGARVHGRNQQVVVGFHCVLLGIVSLVLAVARAHLLPLHVEHDRLPRRLSAGDPVGERRPVARHE